MKAVPTMRAIIARGAGCLTREGGNAIVDFVRGRQCADGGFAGKSTGSDLYYTVFAAGILDAFRSRRGLLRLPQYLTSFGDGSSLDFVHRACLAQLIAGIPGHGRLESILQNIEAYRSRDGGYHHTAMDAATGTAYAIYLALEAYAAARRTPPHLDALRAAIETLGSSEDHGQTNATAAACIARMRLGCLAEPASQQFLLAQYDRGSGGFRAYPQAPIPDLLSTATALYALHGMGVSTAMLAPRCRAFVESLWTEEGGFCGSIGDPIPDCEYTCYALIALGTLA